MLQNLVNTLGRYQLDGLAGITHRGLYGGEYPGNATYSALNRDTTTPCMPQTDNKTVSNGIGLQMRLPVRLTNLAFYVAVGLG